MHSEAIDGSRSFGVWPLTQAAAGLLRPPEWPADRPAPQASIEFEVVDADNVQAAADELARAGFTLVHEPVYDRGGRPSLDSSRPRA